MARQGTPANMEKTPYEIRSWSMGDDGFDLGVHMNGRRFRIAVWAENFINSPIATQILLEAVKKMNEDDDIGEEPWVYLEYITRHFLPDFQRLAPPVVHTGKLTLADLASGEFFECEFHMDQERPIGTPVKPLVEDDFEEFDARTLQMPFPIIGHPDVEVPYEDPNDVFSIIPKRVLVHGQPYFYKPSMSTEGTGDEINKYSQIEASSLSPSDLRISRLYAVVVSSKGGLRGLLFHLINSEKRLRWAVDKAPLALREKWAGQINDTVAKLHHIGPTWGDVKADNVLIDEEDNAVVINLDGGTTSGWVEPEMEGSVEGDLQGLERMKDFIFNDSSSLRHLPWGNGR